jgi:hypothetical protein
MTEYEQELFKKVWSLIETNKEGLYWDFKESLHDTADIIKDVLAFSNSDYEGESYIIVGVKEPGTKQKIIKLTQEDKRRLNTNDNNLYLPEKYEVCGLKAVDIGSMKAFSKELTEKLSKSMLISQPQLDFYPLQIKNALWLYVIVVKKIPGVFISKKDIKREGNDNRTIVRQEVLYVRKSDVTIGADSQDGMASEYIRVWKNYINYIASRETSQTEEITQTEKEVEYV